MKRAFTYLLIVALVTTTGCYKRVEIPKDELVNNASFFPQNKETFLITRNGAERKSTELTSFKVEKNQIVGQPKYAKASEETVIPLNDVQKVEKKKFSGGKTALAIGGTIV